MTAQWPCPEQRERYVEFLTLELLVMKSAAAGDLDEMALLKLNALMQEWFPKTKAFIESRLPRDPARGYSDEVRAVAWAEARATATRGGKTLCVGEWTEDEIARDINECFSEARERAAL